MAPTTADRGQEKQIEKSACHKSAKPQRKQKRKKMLKHSKIHTKQKRTQCFCAVFFWGGSQAEGAATKVAVPTTAMAALVMSLAHTMPSSGAMTDGLLLR